MPESKMKTPYYTIHQSALDKGFADLSASLSSLWPNFIIGYSYKTNALPWLVRHFHNLGCHAEVVSDDEYRLARLIGVEPGKVIYNGPVKERDSFFEVLLAGGVVNIDSSREIDWLQELPSGNYSVGIRVNFDLEKLCPGHSQCGDEGGRFGFCYENGELESAISRIRKAGVDIAGLHMHVSSKTRGLEIYNALSCIACEVAERYNLNLSFVDIGGGFFGGVPGKPSFEEYISSIVDVLSRMFSPDNTTLIVEPGISLVGAPVSYTTTVVDVKDTSYNRFIVTDGSRTEIDPLMRKNSYVYSVEPVNDASRGRLDKQVVCGYTCMENDRLFVAEGEPEFLVGDRIVYERVGGYTMCLSPLFIMYYPDVYVEERGSYRKVRDAWSAEEFAARSSIGESS